MSQSTREAIGRTRAFARVVGPFLVAVTLIIAIRLPDLTGLVNDLFSNSVLPWMLGAMMFACRLVVIAFHQYWYSLPAIVISVFGWFVASRGLTLMAFPRRSRPAPGRHSPAPVCSSARGSSSYCSPPSACGSLMSGGCHGGRGAWITSAPLPGDLPA
jgi:hypothetical protein